MREKGFQRVHSHSGERYSIYLIYADSSSQEQKNEKYRGVLACSACRRRRQPVITFLDCALREVSICVAGGQVYLLRPEGGVVW